MKLSYQWLLLSALSLICVIINIDYTAVNLAVIPIANDVHANLNTVQWVLTGYVLAWAIFIIPAGKLADNYGQKRLCLIGLSLFLIASMLVGIATSASFVISARILQGFSSAIYLPTMYALVFMNFPEDKRGFAMGILGLGVGLGITIGPVVGGFLVTWASWRSIFFVNVPLGLIALFIIAKSKKDVIQNTKTKISKASVAFLGSSTVLLLYTLSQWQAWSQDVSFYVSLILIAAITFVGFIYLQLKLKSPLMPLQLFRNKPFLGVIIGIGMYQYATTTIIVTTSLYLQKVMGFTILKSSLIFMALTIVFGVIASMGGKWIDRVGIKLPTLAGFLLFVMGSICFASLTPNSSLLTIAIVLLICGTGMGTSFCGLNTGIVTTVTQDVVGVASGIFAMAALLGSSFAFTFTALIYQKMSLIDIVNFMNLQHIATTTPIIQTLTQFIGDIAAPTAQLSQFMQGNEVSIVDHMSLSLTHGIHAIMCVNVLIAIVGFLGCFYLFKERKIETEALPATAV